VLEIMRNSARLLPRPLIFLRVKRLEDGRIRALTGKMRDTGICDEGGCLFHVGE
jgi:hypothetical protein